MSPDSKIVIVILAAIALMLPCQSAMAGIPIPPAIPGAPELPPSILSFVGATITLAGYKTWKFIKGRN